MIEWIVLIILILAIGILILSFGSLFSLFANIVLVVALAILIHRDINKRNMLKYYLISAVATVFMLIFPFRLFIYLFSLLKKANLSELTQALLLIFLVAYLLRLIDKSCIPAFKRLIKRTVKNVK